MFCAKCGAQLPDGSTFCSACGAQLGGAAPAAPQAPMAPQAPVAQAAPAAPKQSVPVQEILADFLGAVKGLFTKDPVTVAKEQTKSDSMMWIITLGLVVLFVPLALSTGLSRAVYGLLAGMLGGGYAGMIVSGLVPYGLVWLVSLLLVLVSTAVLTFGLWGAARFLYKKEVALIPTLNMVGMALLPVAAVSLLNNLFALLWLPLAIILLVAAGTVSFAMLFAGFVEMTGLKGKCLYGFAGVVTVTTVFALLIALLYGTVISGAAGSLASGMFGGLGSLL